MLEPTDFSESSWTGPGMMEPLYPPAPPMPPTPAPMMDEPMGSPRRKPAGKRKAARPEARRQAETEEDGETASPLADVDGTPRERLSDGSIHLRETLPRYVMEPRTRGGAWCVACGAR